MKQLGPGAQDQGQMKFTYRAQNREWLVLKGDSEGGRRMVQQDTGSSQHRDTGKEGQAPEFFDCIIQESPSLLQMCTHVISDAQREVCHPSSCSSYRKFTGVKLYNHLGRFTSSTASGS